MNSAGDSTLLLQLVFHVDSRGVLASINDHAENLKVHLIPTILLTNNSYFGKEHKNNCISIRIR